VGGLPTVERPAPSLPGRRPGGVRGRGRGAGAEERGAAPLVREPLPAPAIFDRVVIIKWDITYPNGVKDNVSEIGSEGNLS
jgi:hypothetical protein